MGVLVTFLSSPHALLKYISSYSASVLRASLEPGGKSLAPRQRRLSIRIWTVSFWFSVMPRQESGRKIGNINLESCGQILKEMRIIENLVITVRQQDPVQFTGR